MNILFTRFPLESAHGGAEKQTMWLAEGLKEKGHAVSFLGSCPVLQETFQAAGFPSTKLEVGPPPVTKWGALSFLWRKEEMRKQMISVFEAMPKLPDAVFMVSLSEKILLTEWLADHGVNVFWIEHDRIGRWLRKNPWLPSLKKASEKATMVCVSALSKKLYEEMGFDAERIVVVENGIAVPFPDPPAPSPGGGRGALLEEDSEIYRKKPLRPSVLLHARDMRENPTKAEEMLWQELRSDKLGVRFRRQHPFGIRILDFFCHEFRLGIEVDGAIHELPEHIKDDAIRTEGLEEAGVHIIRFTNEEVMQDVQGVVLRIKEYLRSPPPSGEGLGVGEESQQKTLHVGCVARLSPEKGIDVLIHAIADLPEVSLTIVGKGPEESELQRLIREDTERLGLGAARITLKNSVDDLAAFYQSLDVFVLPSTDHDPFGLVAAEAMSQGTATIVTDQCGIAASLTDKKDALIVRAGSIDELTSALEYLRDPETRKQLGEAGRKTALERFSLRRMVGEYERLLQM